VAADINLIAELTLYGRFYEIPEFLFSRRMHPQASSWDRRDAERQRKFWDPTRRRPTTGHEYVAPALPLQ